MKSRERLCIYNEFAKQVVKTDSQNFEFHFEFAVSQIRFTSTIFFANSAWTNYLFREIIMNSPFSKNHYLFRKSTMNSLFISRINYELLFFCEFTTISLSVPRIHFELTICLANTIWIYHLCREFTLNLLFFREFGMSWLGFANSI